MASYKDYDDDYEDEYYEDDSLLASSDSSLDSYSEDTTFTVEEENSDRCDKFMDLLKNTKSEKKKSKLSEEECQKRIKHHEEKAKRLLEATLTISVCFLLDCTESMSPWITQIKDNIKNWKRRFSEEYGFTKSLFSFVGYTDFDHSEDTRTTLLDFTEDPEEFSCFIDQIQTTGGGDTAEDVLGGLKVALAKLNWSPNNGHKILIHITDAPCHGRQYHNADIDDNYPDEDYSHDLRDLFQLLHEKRIQYYFAYIKKEHTDKMIAEFNSIFFNITGRSAYITQLDATSPDSVDKIVFASLEASISQCINLSDQKPKPQLELDQSPPDWENIKMEQGIITPPVDSKLTKKKIKLRRPSHVVTVKRAAKPFAMGTCRYVYHGYNMTTCKQIVLKENKQDTLFKRYLENYHAHLTAMVYAQHFNSEKPATADKVQFVSPSLLEIKEGSKWRHFCIEEYIEGVHEKFSSNAGYVSKSSKINDNLQAFSHYTWQKSRGQLLVCDLQGVVTAKGVILSDPCVLSCTKDMLKYGSTNLGADGIKFFFLHHKCNSICTEMKLQPYSCKDTSGVH